VQGVWVLYDLIRMAYGEYCWVKGVGRYMTSGEGFLVYGIGCSQDGIGRPRARAARASRFLCFDRWRFFVLMRIANAAADALSFLACALQSPVLYRRPRRLRRAKHGRLSSSPSMATRCSTTSTFPTTSTVFAVASTLSSLSALAPIFPTFSSAGKRARARQRAGLP
jgi:hypothetical protein